MRGGRGRGIVLERRMETETEMEEDGWDGWALYVARPRHYLGFSVSKTACNPRLSAAVGLDFASCRPLLVMVG